MAGLGLGASESFIIAHAGRGSWGWAAGCRQAIQDDLGKRHNCCRTTDVLNF